MPTRPSPPRACVCAQLHITDVIGAGAYGVVYLALWRGMPVRVPPAVWDLEGGGGGRTGRGPLLLDRIAQEGGGSIPHHRDPRPGNRNRRNRRNRQVAVKALLFRDRDTDMSTGGSSARRRCLNEAAICSALHHPNVVSTYR
jgi:serine/threonine protein kinase